MPTTRRSVRTPESSLFAGPTELVDRFLDSFVSLDPVPVADIAVAVGVKDKSNPRRGLKKYLETASLFDLVAESRGQVRLTYRGRCVREGGKAREIAIRGAFASEELPRKVAAALLRDTPLDDDRAQRRLQVYNHGEHVRLWYEWLQAGGLALGSDQGYFAIADPVGPLIDLFDGSTLAQVERELYLRLVRNDSRPGGGAELDEAAVVSANEQFLAASDNDIAPAMHLLLDRVLRVLGFEVQRANGEREHRKKSARRPTLDFGDKGDDLAAAFLRTPLCYAESCGGWVLAIEAKGGAAPKAAIGQAVTFAGRVQSAWGKEFRAYPIVVSGRETYADRIAKDYARDNNVLNLPVAALVDLAKRQWHLYRRGEKLITPPAVLSFVEYARSIAYTEPASDELVKAVAEIASRGSAAWLPTEDRDA